MLITKIIKNAKRIKIEPILGKKSKKKKKKRKAKSWRMGEVRDESDDDLLIDYKTFDARTAKPNGREFA
jgi:hypothetical protein